MRVFCSALLLCLFPRTHSKITGHGSSSSDTHSGKNISNESATTGAHQAPRLDERTGTSTVAATGARGGGAEHAAEKATGRDLNKDGQVGGNSHAIGHSSTSTTGTGARGGAAQHAAEKVTGRDLNHDGTVGKGATSTGSTTDRVNNFSVNERGTTGARGGALEHGAEKATGRDLNRDGQVGGQGEHRVQHAAPIVQVCTSCCSSWLL